MTFDYAGLSVKAAAAITKFDQGNIFYVPPGTTTGPEWDPQPVAAESVKIQAVAFGVSAKYVDELVRATDIEVTAAVWSGTPVLAGTVTIAGVSHEIVRITRIPAAGDVVAWQMIVRA